MNRTAIEITGKLTEPPANGHGAPQEWVYQRTAPGHGNVPGDQTRTRQRRRHVIPEDRRTAAQLECRAAFAAAVAAWQDLTPEAREIWKTEGAKRSLPGYQWFLSNTLGA